MSEEGFDVRLRLAARAENVAVVRQALSGLGEALEVDSTVLADMKTAVTEACNNAVIHAYPEGEGTMEIEAWPRNGYVTLVVRDYGAGMQPRSVRPEQPSLGLGVPLIAALSHRFEIHGGTGRGIEVRMAFPVDEPVDLDAIEAGGDEERAYGAALPSEPTAGVSVRPGPMMASVVGRITAMMAARSDFSLDRLSDAVLVTDVISEHVAQYTAGGHAFIEVAEADGLLELRVGPLTEGGGGELLRHMQLPGLERSLEQLADEVRVEHVEEADEAPDGGEYLQLRLTRG